MHIDFSNPNAIPPEFASLFLNPGNGNMNNGIQAQNGRKHNTYLIHERARKTIQVANEVIGKYKIDLRELFLEGKILEAMSYIEQLFPAFLEERKELLKMIHVQQFIEYVKLNDFVNAINYSQKHLTLYQKEKVFCLDSKGAIKEASIDVSLLSYLVICLFLIGGHSFGLLSRS